MYDLLESLLPFVILILFWVFLMRSVSRKTPQEDEGVQALKEIRDELARIRRALEERPP